MYRKFDCDHPSNGICTIGANRIDPCDCKYYYTCQTDGRYIHQTCGAGVIFDASANICNFKSTKGICDTYKPWRQCSHLQDFDINMTINSVNCRVFWPIDMSMWIKRKVTVLPSTRVTKTSTKRVARSTKPGTTTEAKTTFSKVTQLTIEANETTQSTTEANKTTQSASTTISEFATTSSNGHSSATSDMEKYFPAIICGVIAFVAFISMIILWRKRSDVKNLISDFCCDGKNHKPKMTQNLVYTLPSNYYIDSTTGEPMYQEIFDQRLTNRPLPKIPPDPQPTFPETITNCDVVAQKEQVQRVNSASQTYDNRISKDRMLIDARKEQVQRTTSACQTSDDRVNKDRMVIDAQERFATHHHNHHRHVADNDYVSDGDVVNFHQRNVEDTPATDTARQNHQNSHLSNKASSSVATNTSDNRSNNNDEQYRNPTQPVDEVDEVYKSKQEAVNKMTKTAGTETDGYARAWEVSSANPTTVVINTDVNTMSST